MEKVTEQNIEKIGCRQLAFNSAMIYLIEHNVLALKNGKIIFISDNLPKENLFVKNTKSEMIENIKNACGNAGYFVGEDQFEKAVAVESTKHQIKKVIEKYGTGF